MAERVYRLSGMVRFSADHLVFDNPRQAERCFKDLYLESSECVFTDIELVERKIEPLEEVPEDWLDRTLKGEEFPLKAKKEGGGR